MYLNAGCVDDMNSKSIYVEYGTLDIQEKKNTLKKLILWLSFVTVACWEQHQW